MDLGQNITKRRIGILIAITTMSDKTVKAVLADQQTWDSTTSGLSGKKGVDLLKAIEGLTCYPKSSR